MLVGVDTEFRFGGRTNDPLFELTDQPASGTLRIKVNACNEARHGVSSETSTFELGPPAAIKHPVPRIQCTVTRKKRLVVSSTSAIKPKCAHHSTKTTHPTERKPAPLCLLLSDWERFPVVQWVVRRFLARPE